MAFIQSLDLTAAALRAGVPAATAEQVAARAGRRAPPPPQEGLGLHLAIIIEQFGRGSPKLALAIVGAAARYYAKHPDKVAQGFTPVEIDDLVWLVPTCRNQIRKYALPQIFALTRVAVPELPRVVSIDGRDEIRRDKPESTTGPPLKRQRRPLLLTGTPGSAREGRKSFATTSRKYASASCDASLRRGNGFVCPRAEGGR